ncbi:YbeD-like domain superfamily [Sesbania bispinosa]|nr:YbeD-like domain superfamily [Sesbania bispinosa]
MACRSMLRSAILVEPFQFQPRRFDFNPNSNRGGTCFKTVNVRPFHCARGGGGALRCSNNETPSFQDDQGPPQEAVLKAISEVSKTEGRVGQTTNMVLGGTVTDDSTNEWLTLDQKVNSYPTVRGFTAIGTGGEDFVQAMVVAVESVIQQPIPQGRVKQKLSKRGKYVSVNIGPVQVVSSEQVQAVYNAMRRDDRMKYFL